MPLWNKSLNVLCVGSKNLEESLDSQHIKHRVLDWAPSDFDDPNTSTVLDSLLDSMDVSLANDRVISSIQSVKPKLTRMVIAKDVLSCFSEKVVILAGPLQKWVDCSSVVKQTIIKSLLKSNESESKDVEILLENGDIQLLSSLDFPVATTLETVVTADTCLLEFVNDQNPNQKMYVPVLRAEKPASCNYFEVHSETIEWCSKHLMPILNKLLLNSNGFDCVSFIRESIRMGDDGRFSTQGMQLLFDSFISHQLLVLTGLSRSNIYNVMLFFKTQKHLMKQFMMAIAKLSLYYIPYVPNSSIVNSISHNGSTLSIGLTGLKSPLLFEYKLENDVSLGDSCLLDVFGFGTFLIPFSFANRSLLSLLNSSVDEFTSHTFGVTYATHSNDYNPFGMAQSIPLGLDSRKIIDQGLDFCFLSSQISNNQVQPLLSSIKLSFFEELVQELSKAIRNQ